MENLLNQLKWAVNKRFNWKKVSSIGQLKIVKSSAYWLFIVPVVAKPLTILKKRYGDFPLWNDVEFPIALPFSWHLLFFSALVITIANILYYWRCPNLVKQYKTATEFFRDGNTLRELFNYGIESGLKKEDDPLQLINSVYRHNLDKKDLTKNQSLFWQVQEELSYLNIWSSFLCLWLYWGGIFTIAVVMIENTFFVFTGENF